MKKQNKKPAQSSLFTTVKHGEIHRLKHNSSIVNEDFTCTKSTKSTKNIKSIKNIKSTKSTKRQTSDFLPLRCFL